MKYIYKNKKRSITQITCVRIAQNVADMMPGCVSCNLSKIVIIFFIIYGIWKTYFLYEYLQKHISNGRHDNKYVRKIYFSQDYKLYIRSMILSIDIKTLISEQNLEDIFGVIHQRIKGKLP